MNERMVLTAVVALSAGALAAALVAQYGFDLAPCVLCLYQRVPFVLAGLLAAAVLLLPGLATRRRLALGLCALLFLANAGIAFFHVGVEQRWWAGTSGCSAGALGQVTPATLLEAVGKPVVARCDEPAWDLFGITMAGYNVAFCLGLAALCGAALTGRRTWRNA